MITEKNTAYLYIADITGELASKISSVDTLMDEFVKFMGLNNKQTDNPYGKLTKKVIAGCDAIDKQKIADMHSYRKGKTMNLTVKITLESSESTEEFNCKDKEEKNVDGIKSDTGK